MTEPDVKLPIVSRRLVVSNPPTWAILVLSQLFWARPAAAANGSGKWVSLLGLVVMASLLAVLSLSIYLVATYRRSRRRPRPASSSMPSMSTHPRLKRSSASSRQPNGPTPGDPMLALSEDPVVKPRSILLAVVARQPRICPICQREFPSTLSTYPFDQGMLVDKSTSKGPMPREDYLDTHRSVMVCDGCGRYFDLGAHFCLYDGNPLSAREDQDEVGSGDCAMLCPVCGQAYDADSCFCPDDGERLLPDQPDNPQTGFGTLPIVICPRCATEYPSGNKTCPRDGQELLPLVGRKTGGTPIHGIGPKKKVCPACGQRFGIDATYCSNDGNPLLSMN